MADTAICDNPELWSQIRSARDSLFSTGFSQKYGSPPASPLQAEGKSTHEEKVKERCQTVEASQQKTSILKPEVTREKIAESSIESSTKPAAKNSLRVMASQNQPSEQISSFPSTTPPAPSTGVPRNQKTRPQPCFPLSYTKIPSKKPTDNRTIPCNPPPHGQHRAHTPHIRSPLTQGPQAIISGKNKSSKAFETVNPTEATQQTAVKMSNSDDTDEVLPIKRRANNGRFQHGPRNPKPPRRNCSPKERPQPAQKFVDQPVQHKTDDRRVSQVSGLTEGLHKGVSLPSNHQPEASTPSPSPADGMENNRNEPEDPAQELARLRREALVNAHKGGNQNPTASPEALARCRDGPGTDPAANEYHEIAKMRAFPQDSMTDFNNYYPQSSEVFFMDPREDATPETIEKELNGQIRLYREWYKKSATAYPENSGRNESGDDEQFIFSPTPIEKYKRVLTRIRESRRELRPKVTEEPDRRRSSGSGATQLYQNSWKDPAIVDWEYCPRCIADELPYRERFQNWLESTLDCECPVDIFHKAFFNGAAHVDGESPMLYLTEMRNYETILDPADKASNDHAHETAAGYCMNVNRQRKLADEAEEHRKRIEHEIRIQARRQPLRSPESPVANIYLRPVDDRDVPGLKEIYDWYARNSVDSPNTHDLDEDAVRARIEESNNSNLPFIVAIDRRSASSRSEKVLGYACAREFDRHEASRFTAELEVYVRAEHTSLGIGKCLLDKLIELCDATYRPKSDFEFLNTTKLGYLPGGRRRLARMVFTLGYVDGKEISEHKRVKQWLRMCANFEEQGTLRGVREKNGDLINVAYLVRRAGHSLGNRLE
ncbi:uncharacterized protein BDV14DRAFT_195124 [Aspergillus stella-maris]|uniref:uncharacterized protein n=1 Tax=Aspergillus stella-maris TaxID=1810926 RepID=UPI003CCE1420